jgi:hypothetical protein
MFLPCRPCCGGIAPDDPCLASCRPSGETRSLASVNVTLSASDYAVSVETTQSTPSVTYTMNYLFKGSDYNGTFALTPSASDPTVYEYLFSSCAGYTPSIKYYTGRRINNCRLFVDFPALIEPEDSSPVSGENTTPTCGASQAVQLYTEEISVTTCGTRSTQVLDARTCPIYIDPFTGAYVLTGTDNLYDQILDPSLRSFGVIYVFKAGTDRDVNGFDFYVVHGNLGFSYTRSVNSATASESGNPLVTLTNVTTTYA